jgi:hypothetical protein
MIQIIYTLVEIDGRWHAAIGSRARLGKSLKNSLGIRQSFDTKKEAQQWLLDQGEVLKIPSLPATVRATSEPLALGRPIEDDA